MTHAVFDSIIVIDRGGRIIDFYPLAKTALAYRREDVVGCELADVMSPPRLREAHRVELAIAAARPRRRSEADGYRGATETAIQGPN
jgi:PAS domain S-box-containing protein